MNKGSLDYWRNYFGAANSDIFGIIDHAIMVAASDCPKEFRLRRDGIAERLFSCCLRYFGKGSLAVYPWVLGLAVEEVILFTCCKF